MNLLHPEEVRPMVPLCVVHVDRQAGMGQLMDGDIQQLTRLLPNVAAVGSFRLGATVQLTPDEALQLLRNLQALDLAEIGDKLYTRSVVGGRSGSIRNLVLPFIDFLKEELGVEATG